MFSNIVLSGGGMAGIAYLGCLKHINEHKELKSALKNLLGISSGSLFALILALDLTYEEAKSWIWEMSGLRINQFNVHSIKRAINQYGLDDGEGIRTIIRRLFALRDLSDDVTFKELAKISGKNLIIAAANVSTAEIEYFSIDKYPDMHVMKAIQASTAVPIIFVPVMHKDQYFVDAFVYDNFPFQYFSGEEQHTIGLNLVAKQDTVKSCADFVSKLFHSIIKNHSYKRHPNECLIECSSSGFNIKKMCFKVEDSIFDEVVEGAYQTIKNFTTTHRKQLNQATPEIFSPSNVNVSTTEV